MIEDQFPIGQHVTIPGHFPESVVLEAVRSLGDGYECRVRLLDGTPDEAILSSEKSAALLGQKTDTTNEACHVDAEKLRLLIESARIRLAYAHDRHVAVSLSGIRTLPHQSEAVYLKMLRQPRLRFCLPMTRCRQDDQAGSFWVIDKGADRPRRFSALSRCVSL